MKKSFILLLAAVLMAACTPIIPEQPDEQDRPGTETPVDPENPGGQDPENPENQDPDNPGGQDPDTPVVPEPEPEEPQETYYVKVAESYSDWSGDYLITYTSGSNVLVLNSYSDTKGYGADISSTLTSEGIHSSDGDQYKAVVAKSGSGYIINVTGIGFLGLDSSKNSVNASSSDPSSDNYRWIISYKDGGSIWLRNMGHDSYRLQWNASANIFRCYTGSQEELTLYRRDISTGGNGGGTTPTPDPNPEPDPEPDPEPEQPVPDNGGNSSGYLQCYDIPYVSTSLSADSGYSSRIKEHYGSTYAYIYETTNPNQRVVTHTFSNGGRTHRNYTFLYDYQKHCPMWLSYHMNSGYCGKGGDRTDAWAYDPAIPEDKQPNLKNSYCSGGNPYNRGHMLASHARTAIRIANQQAFYFTNMTPQASSNFNTGSGCWNDLEDAEMSILPSGRDTLYVVTGCIFEDGYKTFKNAGDGMECAVPDQFYKCFMLCSFDSNGNMISAKGTGYLMPHDSPLKSGYSKYVKTIDAIETIAGYDFFTNVPANLQSAAESKISPIGL